MSYTGNPWDHWFFTFNYKKKTLQIIRDGVLLETAILSYPMMLFHSSLRNFDTQFGYLGDPTDTITNEFSYSGFKQIEIFRPTLTI